MNNGIYNGIYQLDNMFGFEKGHEYELDISHNGRTYEISAVNDNTTGNVVDLYIRLSNEKNIKKYFDLGE